MFQDKLWLKEAEDTAQLVKWTKKGQVSRWPVLDTEYQTLEVTSVYKYREEQEIKCIKRDIKAQVKSLSTVQTSYLV